MKFFLGIICLYFLLSGNVYSSSAIDSAIESCADTQYSGNEEGIPKAIYKNNVIFNSILNDSEILRKNYDEYVRIYETTQEKYWKDNPRPKYLKQETLTDNFENYKKDITNWYNDGEIYIKPFMDKFLDIEEGLKKYDKSIREMKKSLASKYLKKLNLKDKAKTIQSYTRNFTQCEIHYNTTPKGFMLEWG